MNEPSVLDFVKEYLANLWKQVRNRISGKASKEEPAVSGTAEKNLTPEPAKVEEKAIHAPIPLRRTPFLGLLAFGLALIGQRMLEPGNPKGFVGIILYLLASLFMVIALWRKDAILPPIPELEGTEQPFFIRRKTFILALIFMAVAFLAFGGGVFDSLNLVFWLASLALMIAAFLPLNRRIFSRLGDWLAGLRAPSWSLSISRWTLLVLFAFAISAYFRFHALNQVPPEMVSDHAEKLLDVHDVMSGQWNIFFPRNTGREAFQMYLTAAVISLFHTGFSFLSLKIGTTLAGFFTLPYIYLFGKEIANRRVGLFALLFAGVAYWPNVISRVALRFTLYPFFAAPTLYYLLRGLRRPNPKDFVLAGLFLGLGLHGYSPFRIIPVVILVAIGWYLLHSHSKGKRQQVIFGLVILVIVSFVVFLPLLRYATEHPDIFSYRALTRIGTLEKPLDHPAWQIFLQNQWKALLMFGWKDGDAWVVSIPNRPALSVVSSALFYMGVLMLLHRFLRKRHWLDGFLLLSIPLLMLPSSLSLAFPDENPILNRTAGAIIPVFLIIGLALEGLITPEEDRLPRGLVAKFGWVIAIFVFLLAAVQDYNLVFQDYQKNYLQSAWNTAEMGQIIHDFSASIGRPDNAWVVAYPYWVDTRLVGINAGYPTKDYAIWPDHLSETQAVSGAKLFILNPADQAGIAALREQYPNGVMEEHPSLLEGKTFWIYFVMPVEEQP